MGVEKEFTLKIGSKDVTSQGIDSAIRQLQRLRNKNKETSDDISQQWERVKRNFIVATAGITSAIYTAKKAWDLTEMAASYREQEEVLNNLAAKYKYTASGIVEEMARASDGLIAKSDLMGVALQGLSKKLSPDQLINLAKAADYFGDVSLTSATEALQEMSKALETGRAKGLMPYLGTTLDLEEALGKNAAKLTKAETAQAMYMLLMIEFNKRQREQKRAVDDTADTMDRLAAGWQGFKLGIGNLGVAVVKFTQDILDNVAAMQMQQAQITATQIGRLLGGYGASNIATGQIIRETKAETDLTKAYEAQLKALRDLLNARSDAEKQKKEEDRSSNPYLDARVRQFELRRKKDAEQQEQMAQDAVRWDDWKTEQILANLEEEMAVRDINTQNAIANQRTEADTRQAILNGMYNALGNMAQAFYDLSGEQAGAAWTMYKAFAIAQTIVSTIKSAQEAYEALAWIPGVGPALAAAAAAAAIAAGMARVAAISKTEPGGATTASGTGVTGGVTSTTKTSTGVNTTTTPATTSSPVTKQTVYQVIIQGNYISNDKNARELIKSFRKAEADGV